MACFILSLSLNIKGQDLRLSLSKNRMQNSNIKKLQILLQTKYRQAGFHFHKDQFVKMELSMTQKKANIKFINFKIKISSFVLQQQMICYVTNCAKAHSSQRPYLIITISLGPSLSVGPTAPHRGWTLPHIQT